MFNPLPVDGVHFSLLSYQLAYEQIMGDGEYTVVTIHQRTASKYRDDAAEPHLANYI